MLSDQIRDTLAKYKLQIGTNFDFVRVRMYIFHCLTHTGYHFQPTELDYSKYSTYEHNEAPIWYDYSTNRHNKSCLACCAVATRRGLAARLRLIKQSCPTIARFDTMSM